MMVKINMLEPRGSWYSAEKWRGTYTINVKRKGDPWGAVAHIHLWGVSKTCKAFYTVSKVHKVVHYKEN
jgi:hypothetical protein